MITYDSVMEVFRLRSKSIESPVWKSCITNAYLQSSSISKWTSSMEIASVTEEVVDEMLVILSDRKRIVQKKELESSNAKWNEYLSKRSAKKLCGK